jgi:hypothetical protein
MGWGSYISWGSSGGGTKRKLEKSRDRFNALQQKVKAKESEKEEKAAVEEAKSWFEKLSNDELKVLCKVADMKTTGTKATLIQRLTENPSTAEFATNSKLDCVCRALELKFNKERVVMPVAKKQRKAPSLSDASSSSSSSAAAAAPAPPSAAGLRALAETEAFEASSLWAEYQRKEAVDEDENEGEGEDECENEGEDVEGENAAAAALGKIATQAATSATGAATGAAHVVGDADVLLIV